ncbi:MAG: septal ring lytic transglycosylase RlpA family protein [Alphaproteobacteria bacterium]
MRDVVRNSGIPIILAALALVLGACAEVELAAQTAKGVGRMAGPPPRGEYKVGKPYRVDGAWYYPRENPDYDQTGVASWYGREFHGLRTANGALYNMNALTAAHRTLPMPSLVRVTNLENGRSLVLTVNDRGPFVRNRIIDVSRRAAQLLGFYEKGTARVRVQAVSAEPRPPMIAESPVGPTITPAPTGAVSQEPLPPVSVASVAPPSANPSSPDGSLAIYVQAAAFREVRNARRLSTALADFGPTRMMRVWIGGQPIYRVQVGPTASLETANDLLRRIVAAGYRDARLIVE